MTPTLSEIHSSAAGLARKRIIWHLAPLGAVFFKSRYYFPVPLDTLVELHAVVISHWLRFNLAMETPKPLQSRHAARCARKSSNVVFIQQLFFAFAISQSQRRSTCVSDTAALKPNLYLRLPSVENGFHYNRLLRSHTSTSCVCSLKVPTALPSASTGHELRRRSQRP
jgi:hypothetical protein